MNQHHRCSSIYMNITRAKNKQNVKIFLFVNEKKNIKKGRFLVEINNP